MATASEPCLAASGSAEDLSEYTDADESISAPTEFLAEFLSAVMLKDYETALKYCKLILQYEPNNVTAKEFYPLIVEKLQMIHEDFDSDSESSETESNSSSSSCSSSGGDGFGDDNEPKPTDSDATTASYSSLEDDETDQENNAIKQSRHFSSTDFTNGNTGENYPFDRRPNGGKQRLVEAIQRKLEDNRKVRRPLLERLEELTGAMAKTSLRPVKDEMSPESDKSEGFSYDPATCVRDTPWYERSLESEESMEFPKELKPNSDLLRTQSDVSIGHPFSSDSESPTDPHSQLTVQQAPR